MENSEDILDASNDPKVVASREEYYRGILETANPTGNTSALNARAIDWLNRRGSASSLDALSKFAATTKSLWEERYAARAVWGIQTRGDAEVFKNRPCAVPLASVIDRLDGMLKTETDYRAAETAIHAKAIIASKDISQELILRLQNEKPEINIAICYALGWLADPSAEAPLLDVFSQSENPRQNIFSRSKNSVKRWFSTSFPLDKKSIKRLFILNALQTIGGTRSLELVRRTLTDDPSPDVRRAAVCFLREREVAGDRERLEDALSRESNSKCREEIKAALGHEYSYSKISPGRISPSLLPKSAESSEELRDRCIAICIDSPSDQSLREAAITTLGILDDPDVTEFLATVLERSQSDYETRSALANAITWSRAPNQPSIIDRLLKTVTDPRMLRQMQYVVKHHNNWNSPSGTTRAEGAVNAGGTRNSADAKTERNEFRLNIMIFLSILIAGVVIAGVVIFGASIYFTHTGQSSNNDGGAVPQIGQQIPVAFALPDLNGTLTKFHDFSRGKVTVLSIWKERCPDCMPSFSIGRKLAAHYASNPGVRFLDVAYEGGQPHTGAWVKEAGIRNTVLLDQDGFLARDFGIGTYTVFITDTTGILRYKGPVQNARPVLAALLGETLRYSAAREESMDSASLATESTLENTTDVPGRIIVVDYNECLWSIARRKLGRGSRWTEIAEANHLKRPRVIRVGQTLIIPRS